MELHQREPVLEYFKIIGLHNERDITLEMNGNVKILVGDNGSGKTTLLNCMYYILNKQFEKLNNITFEKIKLKFVSGEQIEINSIDIKQFDYDQILSDPQMREISRYIPRQKLIDAMNKSTRMTYGSFANYIKHRITMHRVPISTRDFFELCRRSSSHSELGSLFSNCYQQWSDVIDRNFNLNVLYLPTYRRVEEDLTNLGHYEEEFNDTLINFGMGDVKQRFNQIRNELRESAVSLYTNLNGKMLTQLTSDYEATTAQFQKIKDTEALKIVLDRVGDSISQETKNSILRLVEQSTIEQEKYHPLVFVLSNLIEVYYEQKELDNAIKEFALVANKYLVNKTFIYNESKVEITIINNRTQTEVELDNLSSGEKQLVSILSKLYLDRDKDYAILFDEPELSLSIEWQVNLLPDILNSGKCGYLLAATHSPFIFQNSLDALTDSLCVEYREA